MTEASQRWEIEDLYSRYNQAVDRFQAAEFADLFAPDGWFESSARHTGKESLRAFVVAREARLADSDVTDQRHWTSNLVVDFKDGHAEAECYLMRVGTERATGTVRILGTGRYVDRLVRIDGRWRFASRKVLP